MAKVELEYSNIPSNVLNQLDSAINYLNDVIGYLQQSSVPNDFYRRTTFSNAVSNLRSQRDELQNIKDWIVRSNKNYDSMIDKLEIQANQLPNYRINKRRTII